MNKELKKRIITSIILIAIVLNCLFINNFSWLLLLSIVSFICWLEFINLSKRVWKNKIIVTLPIILSFLFLSLFVYTAYTYRIENGVVGILFVARVSSGNSTVGEGMEFDVIAAVVVGGTALGGAVGRMTGTLLGVIFIAMIGNGLVHWGIDPDLNKVVRGIIIFLAVVINSNLTLKSNTGPKGDD